MSLLQSLFRQKATISQAFFDVVGQLDAEAHATERHAIVRLLNHIHVVDRIFAAHLRGEAHGYAATNTPETPELDALREAVRASDQGYLELVDALTPPQLAQAVDFAFTDGQHGRMTREEMLGHVLTHGSYHRGEVGQMLKRIAAAPPRELFTAYLHRAEPQRRLPV
ncbi:DinB family protein [Rhizobacter sp. Root404]|uniref:DinB family protein n=1 Tax=Rhizobacter sp. Root404 TaxID=1736528 RepID=UPI0006F8F623|nr:DinB family protein [Rhizobacter sp. Root404]KQW35130.1 damage-inducible protein DinB [Rhizobacter sp. Root404]